MPTRDDPDAQGPPFPSSEGPTFDDPPTTEVGFALAEKVVGGRFKLGERLSWGGMGTIYRALDLVTQREVAVKIPHLGDPINDVRFQAESEAVRSVVCTSVIGYVAHGEDAEEPFLAMELVAGHPLWRHLQRGPLDADATFSVGRRISSALAAIHLGGWIHRDIKPGNVVVAPDGSVKLLDFGLSRPIDGDGTGTATGQLVGTLGYMAPEQLGGSFTVDPRTDVYALGVVLFECLSGKRAFKRTLADVIAKSPEPAPDVRALLLSGRGAGVGDAYAGVLERCLARSPDARPSDGLDVLVQLLASRDSRFSHVPLDASRRVLHALLRTGTARVEGDVRATAMMAEVVSEVVAPSVVVRVGCDPLTTRTPHGHAGAIAALLSSLGIAGVASRLAYAAPEARGLGSSRRGAEERAERPRSVVLVVEDAAWCDSATVERLLELASARSLLVMFASSFDQRVPPLLEDAPRTRIAADHGTLSTDALDPMERWYLRAAAMFGRRFPAAGVAHLVGGEEAAELPVTLAKVLRGGWVEPAPSASRAARSPWYRFTTGAALSTAQRLAAPHELRLGERMATTWLGQSKVRGPEVEVVAAVDVACAALAG